MMPLELNIAEHWETFHIVTALGIFIIYIILDGMYAYYTLAVSEKRPLQAATSGAVMHFLLALGVLSYVQNYLYVIPLALGSWIGTYIVVKRA